MQHFNPTLFPLHLLYRNFYYFGTQQVIIMQLCERVVDKNRTIKTPYSLHLQILLETFKEYFNSS